MPKRPVCLAPTIDYTPFTRTARSRPKRSLWDLMAVRHPPRKSRRRANSSTDAFCNDYVATIGHLNADHGVRDLVAHCFLVSHASLDVPISPASVFTSSWDASNGRPLDALPLHDDSLPFLCNSCDSSSARIGICRGEDLCVRAPGMAHRSPSDWLYTASSENGSRYTMIPQPHIPCHQDIFAIGDQDVIAIDNQDITPGISYKIIPSTLCERPPLGMYGAETRGSDSGQMSYAAKIVPYHQARSQSTSGV